MAIKKTQLLVAELRMIADTVANKYSRDILIEAAERLEDTDKIAKFYRNKAEENTGGDHRGRARREIRVLSVLPRTKQ